MRYGWLSAAALAASAAAVVVVELSTSEPVPRAIKEALATRGAAHLPELLGPGQHCVFPTGTVAPLGEASHIFGPGPVVDSPFYNSHDFWFVAFRSGSRIEVHPIRNSTVPLSNDDIICGTELTIRRDASGSFKALDEKK